MNFKELKFGDKARIEMAKGIDILANAVKATLGPNGRNVVIKRKFSAPHITKDGVSVAKEIHLRDEFQDMGAQLVLEVASRTNEVAGDGPQPLRAKILTPSGFTTMGELRVGQLICGTNGSYQTVEEIFDKGIREVYEVEFSDGQVVECCKDHLWSVTNNLLTPPRKLTLSLNRIIADYKVTKPNYSEYRYYVPNNIPEMESKPLPIHPFLLGVLIGDGSLSGETVEISLGLAKESVIDCLVLPEGIEKSVSWVDEKNYFRVKLNGKTKNGSTMVDLIKSLGLNVKSGEKFIPEDYLYNSIENRCYLLEGLAATDGHYNVRYLLEYSTISERLAKDFHQLMLSLGRHTKIDLVQRKGNSYSDTPIYRLYERQGYIHGIKIVDIRATGRFEEMKCIRVSNEDHLYITDNFITTHNTTTSCVLAQAIVNNGLRYLERGVSAIELKRGIDIACGEAVNYLKTLSTACDTTEQLVKIAKVSANSDPVIADLVAQALEAVGNDGIITVERGGTKDTLDVISGMRTDSGYANQHFLTSPDRLMIELDQPKVILVNRKITNPEDLVRICEQMAKEKKCAVLIANEFSDEVLAFLATNLKRGLLNIIPVQAAGFGDRQTAILEDIAIYTGGVVFDSKNGLAITAATVRQLGECEKITINREETAFISGGGNRETIDGRIAQIRALMEEETNTYNLDKYKERLGALSKGVAVIKVGGFTDVEMREKKDRVDDAICAVRAAMQEGYVPGAGMALMYVAEHLDDKSISSSFNLTEDQSIGYKVLVQSIQSPFRQILENAGLIPEVIQTENRALGDKRNCSMMYNVATQKYEPVKESMVIDPTKVTRSALQNASSIAGLLLTTEVMIGFDGEDKTDNLGMFGDN